jgi:hypothetical protein
MACNMQGDQVRFLKKSAQSVAQRILCLNYYRTSLVVKSSAKLCSPFVIYKNLPKENNHPTGKNSPNLVTLNLTSVRDQALTESTVKKPELHQL